MKKVFITFMSLAVMATISSCQEDDNSSSQRLIGKWNKAELYQDTSSYNCSGATVISGIVTEYLYWNIISSDSLLSNEAWKQYSGGETEGDCNQYITPNTISNEYYEYNLTDNVFTLIDGGVSTLYNFEWITNDTFRLSPKGGGDTQTWGRE